MTTPLDSSTDFPAPFQPQKSNLKDNPISPRGRFTRMSYLAWLFISSMVYTCILFIAFGFGIYALSTSGNGFTDFSVFTTTVSGWCSILILIISLIIYSVISICISIRRLHDMNQSGWLFLLMLIPFLGILFLLYLYIAKGDSTANKYGPYRETEQTEKVLGVLFSIIVSVYTVVTLGSALVLPELLKQQTGYVLNPEELVLDDSSDAMNESSPESIEETLTDSTEEPVEEELDSTMTEDHEQRQSVR